MHAAHITILDRKPYHVLFRVNLIVRCMVLFKVNVIASCMMLVKVLPMLITFAFLDYSHWQVPCPFTIISIASALTIRIIWLLLTGL